MNLDDIDFGGLYRAQMARASRRARRPGDWDERAPRMGRDAFSGRYVAQFVARMNLEGCATLLDVGCGPGTIALTVAPRLSHVYGLDYSAGMLAEFAEHARARGLTHATPVLRAWEDDWSDVPVCDVVVASRSTHVDDLEAALAKLDAHAARRVYLTHSAGGRVVDAALLDAIGRSGEPMPDYIYVLNVLRRLGIHPTLDYIESDDRAPGGQSFEDFLRRVTWSQGELTPDEQIRLRAYYERLGDAAWTPLRWAFVSWDKASRLPIPLLPR